MRGWAGIFGLLTLALICLASVPAPAQRVLFQKAENEDAVRQTLWRNTSCLKLGGFQWQVGNGDGVLMQDYSVKGAPPSETASFALGDAAAFIFATFLLEKTKGQPAAADIDALRMTSGYNAPITQSCNYATTVQSCFNNLGGLTNHTGKTGIFHYGPGHLQKLAVDMGFGRFRDGQMRDVFAEFIGVSNHYQFETMRLLDGLRMTPRNLSRLLQQIVGGKLRMQNWLGRDAVCTDKNICPDTVSYAPLPWNRDYALGHWVNKSDDGKTLGYSIVSDGGFYAWITPDKKNYGFIVPQNRGYTMYRNAVRCGRAMQRAFETGKTQCPCRGAIGR